MCVRGGEVISTGPRERERVELGVLVDMSPSWLFQQTASSPPPLHSHPPSPVLNLPEPNVHLARGRWGEDGGGGEGREGEVAAYLKKRRMSLLR